MYSIGFVANLVGYSTDTLRRWERKKKIKAPPRSPDGRRLYGAEELQSISTFILGKVDSESEITKEV